jgi:hypothetical protein
VWRLKVLTAGLAADPALPRRLRAEAQSVAALSHPHITCVYDIRAGLAVDKPRQVAVDSPGSMSATRADGDHHQRLHFGRRSVAHPNPDGALCQPARWYSGRIHP